tara:strand:- start:8088 stop:8525 length:438 start_codon:yes stop_codon:yes gene_type:complete
MTDTTIDNISAVLIEQNPDAIIHSDLSGTIRTWNEAAVRIFGFSKEQALGANLDIIIPEPFRKAHWDGFERAVAEGKTKYVGQSLPTKALKDGGETFYVELSFSIVVDAGGEAMGVLSTARDITERFLKERENRKLLSELQKASS